VYLSFALLMLGEGTCVVLVTMGTGRNTSALGSVFVVRGRSVGLRVGECLGLPELWTGRNRCWLEGRGWGSLEEVAAAAVEVIGASVA
jgi:hypothetical protein